MIFIDKTDGFFGTLNEWRKKLTGGLIGKSVSDDPSKATWKPSWSPSIVCWRSHIVLSNDEKEWGRSKWKKYFPNLQIHATSAECILLYRTWYRVQTRLCKLINIIRSRALKFPPIHHQCRGIMRNILKPDFALVWYTWSHEAILLAASWGYVRYSNGARHENNFHGMDPWIVLISKRYSKINLMSLLSLAHECRPVKTDGISLLNEWFRLSSDKNRPSETIEPRRMQTSCLQDYSQAQKRKTDSERMVFGSE